MDLWKIVPLVLTVEFCTILSRTMLKKSHDRASPCLKPFLTSNASVRSFPTLIEQRAFSIVILHKRISLSGMPKLDIAL